MSVATLAGVAFLSNLDVRVRRRDGRRILLAAFAFVVEGRRFEIPEGFDTDYSSYPPLTSWVVRWSRVALAGLIHDYLYRTQVVPRAEADRIWRLVARTGSHSASSAQAWVSWVGLRVGGWWAWRRHARALGP